MGNCVSTSKPAGKPGIALKPQSIVRPSPPAQTKQYNSPQFAAPRQSEKNSTIKNSKLLVDPLQNSNKLLSSHNSFKPIPPTSQIPYPTLTPNQNFASNISFQPNPIKIGSNAGENVHQIVQDVFRSKQMDESPSKFSLPRETNQVNPERYTSPIKISESIGNSRSMVLESAYKPNYQWVKEVANENFSNQLTAFAIPSIDLKIS